MVITVLFIGADLEEKLSGLLITESLIYLLCGVFLICFALTRIKKDKTQIWCLIKEAEAEVFISRAESRSRAAVRAHSV